MNIRKVRILGKTVPLTALIAVMLIGSVAVGAVGLKFLTIIGTPYNQDSYTKTEEITISEIAEFIEAGVTLDGETIDGAFALGRPITVSLIIRSIRPNFRVTDHYTLTIDSDEVLSGSFVDLEMGTDYTPDPGTWTPSTAGPVMVTLNIADMLWTEITEAVFTSNSFTSSRHPDAINFDPSIPEPLTLVSQTIPIQTPIESGATIDFEYTVEDMQMGDGTYTSHIYGWLWEAKYRLVGETAWIVATSGKVYTGQELMNSAEGSNQYTVTGLSFTAPAPGDYELLINCWNVHYLNPGPAP